MTLTKIFFITTNRRDNHPVSYTHKESHNMNKLMKYFTKEMISI